MLTLPLWGWVGWVVAALALGLWWGERGRRQAAERILTYGSPEDQGARRPVSRAPAREAEERYEAAVEEAEQETVERIADGLLRQAEAKGIEGFSREQALKDAAQMLNGMDIDPAMV